MEPNSGWILKDNDKILRLKAQDLVFPINDQDKELIDRMQIYIDACYNKQAKKYDIRAGIALAGPQVGLTKKVIYIHTNIQNKEYKYLIANPKMIAESVNYAYVTAGEGCLSVEKDVPGIVKRRNRVIVAAYDLLQNQQITIDATGLLAICLQHEMDHLNGILYYDKINKDYPLSVEKEWIKY